MTDGYVYQLPEHLARLSQSARMAGIQLPRSEEALARIILDTAGASRRLNGAKGAGRSRVWGGKGRVCLGAGRRRGARRVERVVGG